MAIKNNWVDGDACLQVDSQHGIQRGEFPDYSDMGNQQLMYQKTKCPNWPDTNIVMLDRVQLIANPFNQISTLPWGLQLISNTFNHVNLLLWVSFFFFNLKSWYDNYLSHNFWGELSKIIWEKWKVSNIISDIYLMLNK